MVNSEILSIQVAETLSSFISIVACLLMSKKILRDRVLYNSNSSLDKSQSTRTLQIAAESKEAVGHSKSSMNLLASSFFLNFALAIFWGIGNSGTINPTFCQFQAFFLQWLMLADVFIAVLMTYQIYLWIVLRKHPKKIDKIMSLYMRIIVISTFILAVVLLAIGAYGDATLWCWVAEDSSSYRLLFFILVIPSWFVVLFLLWEILKALNGRQLHTSVEVRIADFLDSNRKLQNRIIMFVAIFLFSWFFPILNRLVEMVLNSSIYSLEIITVIALPLQGFLNTICYAGGLKFLIRKVKEGRKIAGLPLVAAGLGSFNLASNTHSVVEVDLSKTSKLVPATEKMIAYSAKVYSLFITSLNMGEAPLASVESHLADWILLGHDVYAVGVQECLDIDGLREMILKHLGGPSEYVMFSSEIGSGNTSLGYHGFIALTVFVRKADYDNGSVCPTQPHSAFAATGQDLIITTAQNKGGVGLPLQIHDTSVGFVTCHLPSDSKGQSKLSKRNKSAHSILKKLILTEEDLGFDMHFQHDHLFMFGDLNYRMTQSSNSSVNPLTGVAVASLIEKNIMGDGINFQMLKYNLLRHNGDRLYPTKDEIDLINRARKDAKGAWSSVLQDDELLSIMEDGDAFSGFLEPMPLFAPTYKRRKGDLEGDCGDYTDPIRIIHGFTNTGTVEEEMIVTQRAIYQPKSETSITSSAPQSPQKDIHSDISPEKSKNVVDQSADKESKSGDDNSTEPSSSSTESTGSERLRRKATAIEVDVATGVKHNSISISSVAIQESLNNLGQSLSTLNLVRKQIDPRALRPPSYTDRILYHSLPDQAGRLKVQAYDLCDQLRISDHRAVSMVVLLETNSAIAVKTVKDTAPPSQNGGVKAAATNSSPAAASNAATICEPVFEIFELCVWNISVELMKDIQSEVDSDDEEAEKPKGDNFESSNPLLTSNRASSLRLSRASSTSSVKYPLGKGKSVAGSAEDGDLQNEASSSTDEPADATHSLESRQLTRKSKVAESKKPAGFMRRLTRKSVFYTQAILTRITGSVMEEVEEGDEEPNDDKNDDLEAGQVDESGNDESSEDRDSVSSRLTITADITMASDNTLLERGKWRQRMIEEERKRKELKKQGKDKEFQHTQKIIKTVKKGHKVKKEKKRDRKVHHCAVVFPLPSKDPFLSHKKLYDVEQIYNFEDEQSIVIDNHKGSDSADKQQAEYKLTREDLLRPISIFSWSTENSLSAENGKALQQRSSLFEGNNASETASGADKHTGQPFKVVGCASRELGAHVLLKFSNKSGYPLGSCVVCLTGLMSHDKNLTYTTTLNQVPLSSGGQKRGELSAKFSMRYIPSPLSK